MLVQNMAKSIVSELDKSTLNSSELKRDIETIKSNFGKTTNDIELFLKNDKFNIDSLKEEQQALISELTTMKAKLKFVEKNVDRKLDEYNDNYSDVKLLNERLRVAVVSALRSTRTNEKRIVKIVNKSFSKKRKLPKEIKEGNSLSDNIFIINNNMILIDKKLNTAITKMDEVIAKNNSISSVKVLSHLFSKSKKACSLPKNYFVRYLFIRLVTYISIILGGISVPEVTEFLKYIVGE